MKVTSIFIYNGEVRGMTEEEIPYPQGERDTIVSQIYLCPRCGTEWARWLKEPTHSHLAFHIPCTSCGGMGAGRLLPPTEKPQGTGGIYVTPPQALIDQHRKNTE